MDWSLLRPHAPYPMLRQELLYHTTIPVSVVAAVMQDLTLTAPAQFYYFAIVREGNVLASPEWIKNTDAMTQVSNMLIRFIWVIYIPSRGPNYIIRTFIAAVLEILRRWQWNFCGYCRARMHPLPGF